MILAELFIISEVPLLLNLLSSRFSTLLLFYGEFESEGPAADSFKITRSKQYYEMGQMEV